MAKGKFPFALFEKSAKDKEGNGKEGSKKEEAFDKKQKFAEGGRVDPRAAAAVAAMQRRPPMPAQAAPRPVAPQMPMRPGMKAGGSVSKFAKGGGIEQRGKTVGKTIVMKKGGKC